MGLLGTYLNGSVRHSESPTEQPLEEALKGASSACVRPCRSVRLHVCQTLTPRRPFGLAANLFGQRPYPSSSADIITVTVTGVAKEMQYCFIPASGLLTPCHSIKSAM